MEKNIKNAFRNAGDWISDNLRRICGEITPDKRVFVTLAMILLLAGGSLYMTVSSIYRFGRNAGKKIRIEHIEKLQFEQGSKADSLQQLNRFLDEYEQHK